LSEIRATTISDAAGTGPITLTGQSAAKASLNYKGTATNSIRYSFNISSVTDNNTGDYTTNFTNSMASADYTVTCAQGGDTSNNEVRIPKNGGSLAASNFAVNTVLVGSSINDTTYLFETIHGDLA
jgi:maltoporin